MAFLSIVIPAIGSHTALIRRSVLSALDSPRAAVEIIVIQTSDLIPLPEARLPVGSKVRALRIPTPLTLKDAINRGFAEARGEFIGVLIPGSYYEPAALEMVSNTLQDNQDIDVLSGGCGHFSADHSKRWHTDAMPWSVVNSITSASSGLVSSATFFRRQQAIDLGGCRFDHTWDFDLWIRMSECGARFACEHSHVANQLEPIALTRDAATRLGREIVHVLEEATQEGSRFHGHRVRALAAAHHRALTMGSLAPAALARHVLAGMIAEPAKSWRFCLEGFHALTRPRQSLKSPPVTLANLSAVLGLFLLATMTLVGLTPLRRSAAE